MIWIQSFKFCSWNDALLIATKYGISLIEWNNWKYSIYQIAK